MGVRNKERRQAKARDRKRRARVRACNGAHVHGPHWESPDIAGAVEVAAREALLAFGLGETTLVDEIVRELADTGDAGGRIAPATVDDRFWAQLAVLGAEPGLGEAAGFVARWASAPTPIAPL